MDVWSGLILVLVILIVFLYGFYLMKKLDRFLNENRKAMKKENEYCEPSCVMLTEMLTDEEMVEEIRRFRSNHEEIYVMLYDSPYKEISKEK